MSGACNVLLVCSGLSLSTTQALSVLEYRRQWLPIPYLSCSALFGETKSARLLTPSVGSRTRGAQRTFLAFKGTSSGDMVATTGWIDEGKGGKGYPQERKGICLSLEEHGGFHPVSSQDKEKGWTRRSRDCDHLVSKMHLSLTLWQLLQVTLSAPVRGSFFTFQLPGNGDTDIHSHSEF